MAPRGEAERVGAVGLGEPGGGEAAWPGGARREADGLWSAGQKQGRVGRAEREREMKFDSKIRIFLKDSF